MNQWLIGFAAIMALLVGLTIGILLVVHRSPSSTVYFKEAVQDLGAICASSVVKQQNDLTVNGRAYIQLAATIYNLETNLAYYPLTQSYVLAVDTNGRSETIKDFFTWNAPALPPARYKRVLAAAIYRNVEPLTMVSTFQIVECTADGKPIPKPIGLLTPTP